MNWNPKNGSWKMIFLAGIWPQFGLRRDRIHIHIYIYLHTYIHTWLVVLTILKNIEVNGKDYPIYYGK